MNKRKSNSIYWRNKADKEVSRYYRGLPCAICQTTYKTCGHHIVSKSISAFYRHHPRNLIALCPTHHKFGNDIAAHSKNLKAVEAFIGWLKTNHPKRYELLDTYKQHNGQKVDYEEAFHEWREMNSS